MLGERRIAAAIGVALFVLCDSRLPADEKPLKKPARSGASEVYTFQFQPLEAKVADNAKVANKAKDPDDDEAAPDAFANAIEDALKAVADGAKDAAARRKLGASPSAHREMSEAERDLRAAIELNGDDPKAHVALAYFLQQAGKLDDAAKEYAAARRLDPKNWTAHFGLGSIYLGQKERLLAEECFREAARLAPDNAHCRSALGRTFVMRCKFDEAVDELSTAVKLDRLNVDAHVFLGTALYFQDKDLEAAIGYCRDAIRLDEENVVALGILAGSLKKVGDFAGAEEACREMLRRDLPSSSAHRCLGENLALQAKYREAIEPLREAIRLDPKDGEAHKQLGICLLELLESPEDALKHLKTADRLAPSDSETQMRIGAALARLGQLEQAEKAMRTAIAFDPFNAHAHLGLGDVLAGRGDEAATIAAFREAVSLNCDRPEARERLAILLAESGDVAGALETLRERVSEGSDPVWTKLKVDELQGRLASAPRIALALSGEIEPGDAKEASLFASAAYDAEDYLRAARWWSQAFDTDPALFADFTLRRAAGAAVLAAAESNLSVEESSKWRKQALAWVEKRRAECASHLTDAPAIAKQAEQSLFRLRYFRDLGDVRDDAKLAELPSEEAESWREIWRRIDADREALVKRAAEPYDELAELRKSAEAKPNDADAHYRLGIALFNAGRHADSVEPFREAVRLDPEAAIKRRYLGVALAYSQRAEEGLAQVDEAIRLAPNDGENYISRAYCLGDSKANHEQMIESARTAIRLAPESPIAMIFLGALLIQSEEFAEAEVVLREAVRCAPSNVEALQALGIALLRQEKSADAVETFRQVIRRHPRSATSYLCLGESLAKLDRSEAAVHAFREAVRLDPASLKSHLGLLSILWEEDRKLEAEPVIRAAIPLDPENAYLRQALGTLLVERHEYSEATEALRMAIAIDPADPQSHVLLGASLEGGADPEAALQSYRRAVDLAEPNSEAAAVISERIAALTKDKAAP